MPKKLSVGAQRRSSAKQKAQESLKPQTPDRTPAKRAPKKAAGSRDPSLVEQPVDFNPAALKFVLTPPAPVSHHEPPAYEYLGELPDSYGTKKLFLVARDPHWLHAYWDLSDEQFMEATHAAHDGKVFLELFRQGESERLQQIQIPRGARNWYLPSGAPDRNYYARIGGYSSDGSFVEATRSGMAYAPRDNFSWRTQTKFVTIPFHLSFKELFDLIKAHLNEGEELAEGLARLQEEGFTFPFDLGHLNNGQDAAATRQAVLDHVGEDFVKTFRIGSMEITEIVRRRLEQMQSSGQWVSSWSSPMGASFGAPQSREFYMHVNAELIIYGGTDPKASVSINGQSIKLRDDGTFSYHFVLPDGRFFIPVEATAPDGLERRAAMLSFLRVSDYEGDVKATGQTPRPEPLGRVA